MIERPSDQVRLAEWIIRSLDGSISAAEFEQLDKAICTDPAARGYYLEFIATYVGLADLAGVLPKAPGLDPALGQVDGPSAGLSQGRRCEGPILLDPNMPEDERIRRIQQYAERQLEQFLQRQRAQAEVASHQRGRPSVIGQVLRTGARFLGVAVRVAKTTVIWSAAAMILVLIGLYIHSNRVVGTLVDTSQALWDRPMDANGPLRPGRYGLEQGYAKIRLKKGVQVILQAPTTFKLAGANRIHLASGSLTANVPPEAKGFVVQTAASRVTDLGTEFGILAGAHRSAEVHVFKGTIECTTDQYPSGQRLVQGEAATFDLGGRIDRVLMAHRPRWFVRKIPPATGLAIPGKRLSIADMVGGGSGLGTGVIGQGIDPSTGLVTNGRQVLKKLGSGFAVVPGLPYIDGVFVPDANHGPVVVSSSGVVFRECPATLGTCFETILYGAIFQAGSFEQHAGVLAGRTYCSIEHPSIGMHPNCGITFDLDKIRSCMPDCHIQSFKAICGISQTALEYSSRDWDPNQVAADFWVLLDGRIRFHRRLGIVPLQHADVEVAVSPQDRFLTLATTTEGLYRYCWAMFAEPALELTRK